MTPARLLAEARRLVRDPERMRNGAWARSAALLTRQALERSLREVLIRRYKLAGDPSFTSQLLASRAFLPGELARRAAWTWTALSQATHHHGYELAPTSEELERWMETVGEVIGEVGG